MVFITAKFRSICNETNTKIYKGDSILYDYSTKKVYCRYSNMYKSYDQDQIKNDSSYISAHENIYFDSFCRANNI